MGQRIGQAAGREDPGRRRLFQKRRERSVRAVMVPKTPGEKPPGPILSQAQAEAGPGQSPGVRKFFGFCVSSSWKKRSAKRPVKGEEAGNSDQREQPPTGQTTASVSEGQPSRQQAAGQPPPAAGRSRSDFDGRRPSMGDGWWCRGEVFGRAPAPKTPSAARTAWKRLLYRGS